MQRFTLRLLTISGFIRESENIEESLIKSLAAVAIEAAPGTVEHATRGATREHFLLGVRSGHPAKMFPSRMLRYDPKRNSNKDAVAEQGQVKYS
jgi:hypothetical protein